MKAQARAPQALRRRAGTRINRPGEAARTCCRRAPVGLRRARSGGAGGAGGGSPRSPLPPAPRRGHARPSPAAGPGPRRRCPRRLSGPGAGDRRPPPPAAARRGRRLPPPPGRCRCRRPLPHDTAARPAARGGPRADPQTGGGRGSAGAGGEPRRPRERVPSARRLPAARGPLTCPRRGGGEGPRAPRPRRAPSPAPGDGDQLTPPAAVTPTTTTVAKPPSVVTDGRQRQPASPWKPGGGPGPVLPRRLREAAALRRGPGAASRAGWRCRGQGRRNGAERSGRRAPPAPVWAHSEEEGLAGSACRQISGKLPGRDSCSAVTEGLRHGQGGGTALGWKYCRSEDEKCCPLTAARGEIYTKARAGCRKPVDRLSAMTLQNGVEKVLAFISVFT